MTFKVVARLCNDTGVVYSAPMVRRYINGYGVLTDDGEEQFISADSIKVLSMTDEEREIKVEL